MFVRTLLASFVLVGLSAVSAQAQVTFGWNFGTAASDLNPNTGSVAPFTVSAISVANSFGTITTNPLNNSVSSGYAGATGQFNYGQAVNNAVTSLTGNTETAPYYSFSVTPPTGGQAAISSISFGERSTATGAKQYALRSNIDNYATDITAGTLTADSTWRLISSGNIVGAPVGSVNTAVTYRLYVFDGASNAASGTVNTRIDDLTVVFVTPVPEPATLLGVTALGAFALRGLRRRFAAK